MTCEACVPHRRNAGLAVGFIARDNEQFLDRVSRNTGVRPITKHIEHHRGIGHRRKNRAEAVIAIKPLFHKSDSSINGTPSQATWKEFDGRTKHSVDAAEQRKPDPALMRSFRCGSNGAWGLDKQFV